MSFDIFLFAVEGRGGGKFDRSIVEHAFKSLTTDFDGDHWRLQLPGGQRTSGTLYIDVEPETSGFMVNRPPFVPVFLNAIFDVLRQTQTFLIWPAQNPHLSYYIANPDLIADLPADLIEFAGVPTIVSSGAELEAAIELRRK